MEITKPEVSFLIRASDKHIDVKSLLKDENLSKLRKEVWSQGDPINNKKNYTNSGVVLRIFDGKLDDIRDGVLHTVVPYFQLNQLALKLLKSKMNVMIFEVEFSLKKTDLFMFGFNFPQTLLSQLRDLELDVDINHYFFD